MAGCSPVTMSKFSNGPSLRIALHSASICSGVRVVRFISLLWLNPHYTQKFVQALLKYKGIYILMVLPKRSCVYFIDNRAICSR